MSAQFLLFVYEIKSNQRTSVDASTRLFVGEQFAIAVQPVTDLKKAIYDQAEQLVECFASWSYDHGLLRLLCCNHNSDKIEKIIFAKLKADDLDITLVEHWMKDGKQSSGLCAGATARIKEAVHKVNEGKTVNLLWRTTNEHVRYGTYSTDNPFQEPVWVVTAPDLMLSDIFGCVHVTSVACVPERCLEFIEVTEPTEILNI